MKIIVPVIALIIMLVVAYFGYFAAQPCDIDKEFFYCRVHPLTGIKTLGTWLFFLGGTAFAVVLSPLVKEYGSPWPYIVSIGVAFIGLAMIWA